MPEITDEELAQLRAAVIERDELAGQLEEAGRAGEAAGAAGPPGQPVEQEEGGPPEPTHVALLANGDRHEYSGAHPTHVSVPGDQEGSEAALVPVTAVHPLT